MTKGQGVNLELDDLLHPAQAFNNPSEVVNDPDLTVNEKRAILASWASDACAIEAAPELRAGPKAPVRFEDIMEALRALDHQANGAGHRHPFSLRSRSRVSRKRDSTVDRFRRGPAMKDRISYVIGRERNVVRVDFDQQPEPPTPKFPGAAALRKNVPDRHC